MNKPRAFICHFSPSLADQVMTLEVYLMEYPGTPPPYHPHTNKQALTCCTCISMLSPLQRLSPQRMITKFYRAVTGPMPVLIVPSGRPFLPLSFCIISLYREFFACGWTRGLKSFISIYFCSFYGVLWSVTLPLQLD